MRNNIFIALILVAVVTLIINWGITVNEKNECTKLVEYSHTLKDFYITDWQAEMCKHYAIEINVPVI